MFENLMQLLERGVVALERIADGMTVVDTGCKCENLVSPASPAEDVVIYHTPTPEEVDEPAVGDEVIVEQHPSEKEMAAADAAYLEREFIKSELRRKNIKFKEAARTETLAKLLHATCEPPVGVEAKEESAVVSQTQETNPVVSHEPQKSDLQTATKDDARNALVSLSAAKGKDKALEILKTIGGAEKLSDVPEDKYAAIVEACHGA